MWHGSPGPVPLLVCHKAGAKAPPMVANAQLKVSVLSRARAQGSQPSPHFEMRGLAAQGVHRNRELPFRWMGLFRRCVLPRWLLIQSFTCSPVEHDNSHFLQCRAWGAKRSGNELSALMVNGTPARTCGKWPILRKAASLLSGNLTRTPGPDLLVGPFQGDFLSVSSNQCTFG